MDEIIKTCHSRTKHFTKKYVPGKISDRTQEDASRLQQKTSLKKYDMKLNKTKTIITFFKRGKEGLNISLEATWEQSQMEDRKEI